MLRDLLGWALYSPRRLLAVTLPVLALAVAGTVALDADEASVPARGPAPTRSAEPPVPSPSSSTRDTGPGGHTEARAPVGVVRAAARDFLDAYVVPPGETRRAVPRSLRALTTPALWRGLRLTDPGLLPRGRAEEVEVTETGAFSARATGTLGGGPDLEVALVAWDDGWRVSDVRPGHGP